jgi:hypothetical protein
LKKKNVNENFFSTVASLVYREMVFRLVVYGIYPKMMFRTPNVTVKYTDRLVQRVTTVIGINHSNFRMFGIIIIKKNTIMTN